MTVLSKRLLQCIAAFSLLAIFGMIANAVEEPSGVNAEKALAMLKEGNAKFVADLPTAKDIDSPRRAELAKGQHPFAVVLACADSRVPPEYIFNQGLGDIFVVRVAGNIADPYVIGSVEYAVEHLHVPLVVVLGHEKCGAVTAAMAPEKPGGNLGKLIAEIETGDNASGLAEKALPNAIRNNTVRQTVRMTSRSDILKESVQEKKVKFVTGIYHLDDGKVEWIAE